MFPDRTIRLVPYLAVIGRRISVELAIFVDLIRIPTISNNELFSQKKIKKNKKKGREREREPTR